MDLLVGTDAQAKVQEAVGFAVADLLNLVVDLLLFDTTSTYFERDSEPDDGSRRFGHSKDHRSDVPQILIGLAVTKEGIPVRRWCWPGNTNHQAGLLDVRDGMRDWRLGRVVTIVDRGMFAEANLECLTRAGGHYIALIHAIRTVGGETEPPVQPQEPSPGCIGNSGLEFVSADTSRPTRQGVADRVLSVSTEVAGARSRPAGGAE